MFELVRDVARYPEFLGWVRAAEVHEENPLWQRATLEVQLIGMVRRFTTRNSLVPAKELLMELDSGPFRNLRGKWCFQAVGEGCRVSLDLAFDMGPSLLMLPFQRSFSQMADRMVDDFTRRAEQVHGR